MPNLETYGRGWFCIGFSIELPVGGVKPMHYFGQHLVLFRGEDGVARVFDAHCPHLGAHFGYGGTVVGETLRCPFHGWRFEGSGNCIEVPYATKIPARAQVRRWPVKEQGGVLFVHHDPERRPPEFDPPDLSDVETDAWTPWSSDVFHMKTQPREVVENIADRSHFPVVHNTILEEFDFVIDGPRASQITKGRAIVGEKHERFSLNATYYGPGILLARMAGYLKSIQLVLTTPIDEGNLDLRYAVSLKRFTGDDAMQQFAQQYLENLKTGFLQDQAIWENKVFRDRPVLCDGDGPIGALRRWYRQFYTREELSIEV